MSYGEEICEIVPDDICSERLTFESIKHTGFLWFFSVDWIDYCKFFMLQSHQNF